MTTCEVSECEKPIYGRKPFCRGHFDRWKRHGDPLGGRHPGRGCSISGCDQPHRARGWCRRHLNRWRNHGDPLAGSRSPGVNRCSVDGCERTYASGGYCRTHLWRVQVHGDPHIGARPGLEERFWSKVDRRGPDECWPWIGAEDGKGYGRIHYKGGLVRSHRLSYILANGEPGPEVHIRHTCDNPPCVNPAHLIPGSHADNMDDTAKRGRRKRKWTDEQLEAMKSDPRPVPVVAAEYGMSVPYAYVIRKYHQPGMNRSI